jgi:hypothetical protein
LALSEKGISSTNKKNCALIKECGRNVTNQRIQANSQVTQVQTKNHCITRQDKTPLINNILSKQKKKKT